MIVEFFCAFATPATRPVIGVLVAGVVNIFIPSGGGQWVAMGPIMLDITTGFGYGPEQAVIIEMLGDRPPNIVQPFWTMPLLVIADQSRVSARRGDGVGTFSHNLPVRTEHAVGLRADYSISS